MAIEIVMLGTSAGVPTKRRNLSSIALRPNQSREWLLFDCGEATQHQIMKSSVSIPKIDKIFITHLHGDHIYGIFGLLASRAMSGIDKPLTIYAPMGIEEIVETVVKLSGLNLAFDISYHTLKGGERIDFAHYSIETVKLSHSIESIGYIYIERDREGHFDIKRAKLAGIEPGPIIAELKRGQTITLDDGRVIDGKEFILPPQRGKRIIIGGDNDSPELFEKYQDIDLMIHEATYTQRDFDALKQKFKHTTVQSLAITAQKIGVKKLVLTHISPRYDTPSREAKLLEEAKRYYKGEVILAKDLMTIQL